MPKFRFLDEDVTTNEMPKSQTPSVETARSKQRFRFLDEKPENEPSVVGDIAGQGLKGLAKGFGGTYGDILDLFGLQSKGSTPGEAAIYQAEAQAPDWQLAFMQDEDILPRYTRLPSSDQIGQGLEALGGPGEAKTSGGRYAERIGQLIGGGVALGSPQVATSAIAGGLGQTAEELGAPKWMQAAIEIGTFLKRSSAGRLISSSSKEIGEEIKRLRNLGYSEEDITLAKNALENRGWLKKTSKLDTAAENRFKQALQGSEQKIETVLEGTFPGLKEEGVSGLRNVSEELFQSLDDLAKNVIIERPEAFVKNADKAMERLRSTLANTPQEKEVISILEAAKNAAVEGRTADVYTRFYRGLNQIGKWGSPKEREHVFTLVKDAIKQTFRDQGPEGQKVATALEDANKSWMKYLAAQDVTEMLSKVTTEEGIQFNKLNKLLDNPSNMKMLSKGVGEKQASNLKQIAKTGADIKDLHKAMEGGDAKRLLGVGKLLAIGKALTGDIVALKAYVGAQTLGKISTKLLTDPKYQNFQLRMLKSIKNKSWDEARIIAQSFEKEIDDQKGSVRRK